VHPIAKVTTLCPQKTCDYIFYNNFNDKCPITIIFGIVSSKTHRLTTDYAKKYCNRTLIVKVIVENVVTFWGHSVLTAYRKWHERNG